MYLSYSSCVQQIQLYRMWFQYLIYLIGLFNFVVVFGTQQGRSVIPYRPPGYRLRFVFHSVFLSSNCTKNIILFRVKSECTPFLRYESLYIASLSFIGAIFCGLLSSAAQLCVLSFGNSASVSIFFPVCSLLTPGRFH